MNKKVIRLLIAAFILVDLVVLGFFVQRKYFKPKKVHFHTGLHVYVDGKLQDFSTPKYMSLKPCKDDEGKSRSSDELQNDKAHLHDNVGIVAHSHVDGGKWGDLFRNMNYKVDDNKSIKGYVNGVEQANILDAQLKPYESVVIFIGKEMSKSEALEKTVTKEEIIKIEKTSKDCGV